jgi:hypothetical protein
MHFEQHADWHRLQPLADYHSNTVLPTLSARCWRQADGLTGGLYLTTSKPTCWNSAKLMGKVSLVPARRQAHRTALGVGQTLLRYGSKTQQHG